MRFARSLQRFPIQARTGPNSSSFRPWRRLPPTRRGLKTAPSCSAARSSRLRPKRRLRSTLLRRRSRSTTRRPEPATLGGMATATAMEGTAHRHRHRLHRSILGIIPGITAIAVATVTPEEMAMPGGTAMAIPEVTGTAMLAATETVQTVRRHRHRRQSPILGTETETGTGTATETGTATRGVTATRTPVTRARWGTAIPAMETTATAASKAMRADLLRRRRRLRHRRLR